MATAAVPTTPRRLRLLHADPDSVNGGRIVDDLGREVLLRGVNVNSYVDYWSGNEFPTVFPFTDEDIDRIAEFGWNLVRLLFSWSRVEPQPGLYDDAYLAELASVVNALARRGIYTLLDSHQDAWGPTLAARRDEVCPEGSTPAAGWDGAPGWATLVADDIARCAPGGVRELSPAVLAAVHAFFENAEGPGGVGIRTRYVEMWGHVAEYFAHETAIAGYDLLNEPNAFTSEHLDGLATLYSEAAAEIRAAEARAGGLPHMLVFEPSGLWSETGSGPPPLWSHDGNVAYSPHIYQGAFTGGPITREAFVVAVDEAKLFGGVPILIGEWGTAAENHRGTPRVGPEGDGYFIDHQGWQDEFHMSATVWEWKESFGDPHKIKPGEDMTEFPVAGVVDVDPRTNAVAGERVDLIQDLMRPYPRAIPGTLTLTAYDPTTGSIDIEASDAKLGAEVEVFYPATKHGMPTIESDGIGPLEPVPTPGGNLLLRAVTTKPNWSLSARS